MTPDAKAAKTAAEELAEIARAIAHLLSKERYDEAELAELDARAATLRAQIRQGRDAIDAYRWAEAQRSGWTTGG